jgi:drug/metabolite transporter (DMT)-like permease
MRLDPRGLFFIIGLFGIATIGILGVTHTAFPSLAVWGYGACIAALQACIIVFAFKAFRRGEVSRLAPLSVLATLAIIVGGILFFDEPFTKTRAYAFALLLLGTALLSTRFVKQVEILDPLFYPKLVRKAKWHVVQSWARPLQHSARVARQLGRDVERTVRSAHAHTVRTVQSIPRLFVLRTYTKPRLARGVGWYLAAVTLVVPYSLLNKELVSHVGTVSGFVAVRVWLGIFLLLVALMHWSSVRSLRNHPKAVVVACIKEPFGIAIGFLLAYALTTGELGVIRSITSLEAAGIFVLGGVLAWFGVLAESLRPRDLLQKGVGAACMVFGSILLFH